VGLNYPQGGIESLTLGLARERRSHIPGGNMLTYFSVQPYYVYVIFCSNLKTDFGQKLVRDYKSSQNAQAIWKELSNDAERSTVAQLNATNLLQYTHTARVEN
jgi:hypothetical protein